MNTTETEQPYPVPHTLPKAEMHVHISLALDEASFTRRIKRHRTTLDTDFLTIKNQRYYDDLSLFHATYEAMRHMTKTGQELADTTQRYLEHIAREGAIYAEISNSFRDEYQFESQVEAIAAGIEAARQNTGIEARIVATTLRNSGHEHAENAANYLAKNHFAHVTGFGVVGDEMVDSLTHYRHAFHTAWHKAGLGLTPHVAEQDIQNALDFLMAVPKETFDIRPSDNRRLRVGHGTLIHTSSTLMDAFHNNNVCLEVCLSANKRIGLPEKTRLLKQGDSIISPMGGMPHSLDMPLRNYFNNLSEHPITEFHKRGIRICLGSDNPLLMNTNIGKEYSLAYKLGLTEWQDQLRLTENAIQFANIDPLTRQRLMAKIDKYKTIRETGREPSTGPNGYVRAHIA